MVQIASGVDVKMKLVHNGFYVKLWQIIADDKETEIFANHTTDRVGNVLSSMLYQSDDILTPIVNEEQSDAWLSERLKIAV